MKKKLTLALVALALCAGGAMAKDIRKVAVTTHPQMHCAGCENKIKNFFKFEKGIKKIETDLDDQTVTITYDADKTSEQTIIDSFSKINYEVEKLPQPEEKKEDKK